MSRRDSVSFDAGCDRVPTPRAAGRLTGRWRLRSGEQTRFAVAPPVTLRIVELDPDAAGVFPDSESVNRALRALAEIIKEREGRSA